MLHCSHLPNLSQVTWEKGSQALLWASRRKAEILRMKQGTIPFSQKKCLGGRNPPRAGGSCLDLHWMVILPALEPTGKLEINILNVSFRINEDKKRAAACTRSSSENRDGESVQILMGHREIDRNCSIWRLVGLGV